MSRNWFAERLDGRNHGLIFLGKPAIEEILERLRELWREPVREHRLKPAAPDWGRDSAI